MSKPRSYLWLAVLALPVAAVIAFVVGLFGYMVATTKPIHADAATLPSVAGAPPPAAWTAAVAQARQVVRAGAAAQNLPGVSIAVGSGGAVVWAEGFGYADLEHKTPLTPSTRLRVGDASRALTSAAVGLLLEQHRLKLDDVIQMYVPQFPEKPWPITLRQLMSYTSGVGDDGGDEEPLVREHCAQTTDALRRFADRPLQFEPGTKSRRSSFGWILVSAAVEAAGGEPFFTFMRRVFEPAGMTATTPDSAQASIADRATVYYPRFAGNTFYGPQLVGGGDYACFAGADAFLSTPSDMVRFALAMSGGRLLQRATVETLQTPQPLASGEPTDYALGWKVQTLSLGGQPARMAGHHTKPDFIGGTTSLMTFPERGLVVAVMTNESFADTRSIGLKVAEAFATPRQE